tara:strand:+ start:382 stop:759 length:378 start_codon:yes stop_codon:yes gene_type:complete
MNLKNRPVRVIITGAAKQEFESLRRIVGEEISKGVKKSEHQILLRSINNKIELLKVNPQHGIHIQKNKIPRKYIEMYEVNNLWKINLSGAWRLIYTVKGTKIEILTVILDLMNHKNYSKKFGYKN